LSDFTQILERVEHGDSKAAAELLPIVYEELRRLAAQKMANEAAGHTLQPTALASASADQTIRIWDLASRKCLDVLRGHRLEVWRLALLPDGKTLVSGAKDGTVCLWDTSVMHPHQPRITVPAKVANWCFTPDSHSVVTLDFAGQVARWSGADFQEKEVSLNIATNCAGSTFSPDGRFLAVSFTNGNISVWDLSRRALRREFKLGNGSVTPLIFLARGNRLVVRVAADNHFSEWDIEANREIQSWPAPAISTGFGASPDERLGIAVGANGDISSRNLSELSDANLPLDVLEGWTATFSADGTRLAIVSCLGYARVWNTATWREEVTLRDFLNSANSVAFSPDGKRLATSGSNPDETVKLWDVDSWQELLTLEGEGFLFFPTAFSPDGNAIGAKSVEGILSLWRAASSSSSGWADSELISVRLSTGGANATQLARPVTPGDV
jgi:WD40 repeat protein